MARGFLKHDYLGHGLYSVREAALYARVSPQMVNRWMYGNHSGKAVIEPQYDDKDRVSFLDFVQLLAIRDLRKSKNIPLNSFRQAIQTASERGFEHPFAREHCVYFHSKTIVLLPPNCDPKKFVVASGKHRQSELFPFMEEYMDHMELDHEGYIKKYRVYTSTSGGVTIEMDPKVRFGEPLLPSKYSAPAVWDAIQSEGSVENASKCLSISIEEVRAGAEFYNHLVQKKAA